MTHCNQGSPSLSYPSSQAKYTNVSKLNVAFVNIGPTAVGNEVTVVALFSWDVNVVIGCAAAVADGDDDDDDDVDAAVAVDDDDELVVWAVSGPIVVGEYVLVKFTSERYPFTGTPGSLHTPRLVAICTM